MGIPGRIPAPRAWLDRADVQPWVPRLGAVFTDQMVAAAILAWLLHRATAINIKGKSYRMRRHANALDPSKERPML